MSIFLGKYKFKKKLGKGAYGDVHLVEDPEGAEYALKMISKKILVQDPFMEEYLEGEKDCMMSVKSQYVMRLYGFEEDQNYKYFICQYCDGGDLLNFQAKQPNRVFELKKATKILSQVIHGLELLHHMGYLHRDIKPQNILLKKIENQDDYHYKLADFGFAKKSEDVGGTVLGTENYMSPEIYLQQTYSYEVDMWAFGVVFYFMLNLQFPFKANPHCKDIDQKREDLIKQAKNFSYTQSVKKSKKKLMDNCTKEMDDLFTRIFAIDVSDRITFSQIRGHPIFRQHFPTISEASKILYKKGNKNINRFDSFVIAKKSGIIKNPKPIKKQPEQKEDILPSMIVRRAKDKEYSNQKNFVQLEFDRIRFLKDTEEELDNASSVLTPQEILMLKYCLMKYYIILLRDFLSELNIEILEKKAPLNWKQFCKTPVFKKIRKQYEQNLFQAELKLTQIYDSCDLRLKDIQKINPSFKQIFQSQVTEKQFSGSFKDAYRCSTGAGYSKLRQVFKNGNKYVYLTAIITLTHAFNKIVIADDKELEELFQDYIKKSKISGKKFDFTALRAWMTNSQKEDLKPIITSTFKKYFS